MSDTSTPGAAHIITADAQALGDPAVIVMTPDDGYGAEVIEIFHLTKDATLDSAITWIAGGQSGWTRTGAPTLVERGYWIVNVKRN